jgi:hypothetical protein
LEDFADTAPLGLAGQAAEVIPFQFSFIEKVEDFLLREWPFLGAVVVLEENSVTHGGR